MITDQPKLSEAADVVGNELVIGLVSPVGTELEVILSEIKKAVKRHSFDVNEIRVSRHFDKLVGYEEAKTEALKNFKNPETSAFDRARTKIRIGNQLCSIHKDAGLYARLSCLLIQLFRETSNEDPLTITADGEKVIFVPNPKVCTVIRTLKRKEEVELLRETYGDSFFLIAIQSSHTNRLHKLTNEFESEPQASQLIEIDAEEKSAYGQDTRGVFHLADAFISMDIDEPNISRQVSRIVDLLFGHPYITPDRNEISMHHAFATSLKSGDLSRQVGAVIANKEGDILATGANDVPKARGGQYWEGDKPDRRDANKEFDANAVKRNCLIINIARKSSKSNHSKLTENEYRDRMSSNDSELIGELSEAIQICSDLPISDITEWGRAVHAEMSALMSAARIGISVKDATLYCTTYPCHNCAKHLIEAGITEVQYIEPYPKSYAFKLYSDEIDQTNTKNLEKVVFRPFVGIGPRRFVDLFSLTLGNGTPKRRNRYGVKLPDADSSSELRLQSNVWPYWYKEILESNKVPIQKKEN